jgi:integrase
MISVTPAQDPLWKTVGQNLVRYNPSGTYYVRARVAGKLHLKSLDTPVLSVARQRLGDEVRKLRAQAASKVAATKGKMKVADAIAVYREQLNANVHIKPRTKAYYQEALTALLKSWPRLSESDMKRISEHDCREWASKFFRRFSGHRANNTLMVLRNVLEIAVESGVLYANPARAVKRAKIRSKELVLPDRSQFVKFVREIRSGGGRDSQNCADFVQFIAFSGCRLSEATAVTWQDVDFTKAELTIRGDEIHRTKNSEIRRMPLIPELSGLLQRMRNQRPDEPLTARVLQVREAQKSMIRAAAKVGMQHITHHDLRHLFATTCIEAGIDIPTVSRLLGHKDGGALAMKVYGHLRDDHARAAVAKVRFDDSDEAANVIPLKSAARK